MIAHVLGLEILKVSVTRSSPPQWSDTMRVHINIRTQFIDSPGEAMISGEKGTQ